MQDAEPAQARTLAAARQRQIRDHQLRMHFQYAPCRLAAHLLVATVILFVLWRVVPQSTLLAWYAAIVTGLAVCASLVFGFLRVTDDPTHWLWERYVMVSGVLMGLLWGIGGVVLFPADSFAHQMLLLCLYMSLAAGSLSSSVYRAQYYGFFPLATLPIAFVFLGQGTQMHSIAGVSMALFFALNLASARRPGRALADTLGLQLENADLVEQLREQKTQAERANVAKSRFLAAASHDLRQPLCALTLFGSALENLATSDPLRGIARNINTSVEAMQELFDSLLDISRLDAGALRPEPGHVDLGVLGRRLENDFSPLAREKGLRLRIDMAGWVYSDATMLERVVRNLLSNAIRYTERGEVRLACVAGADTLCIQVIDTGIGIAPAQQREIFDEFRRLGNPERDRTQGLGLGLAIVDRLARLLQHPLAVDSEPGRGSRFSVTVPVGRAPAASPATRGGVFGAGDDVAGLRVMVIDEGIGAGDRIDPLLNAWGCRVHRAGSDVATAAALDGSQPEALIVDLRRCDERTRAQRVESLRRRPGFDVPVLVLSAGAKSGSVRAVAIGQAEVLHQPVSPAALRAFLRNARSRHGAPECGTRARLPALPRAAASPACAAAV